MSRFLNQPILKLLDKPDEAGRPVYELQADLFYENGPEDSCEVIVVPKGRLTNLATVPRSWFLRWAYWSIADINGPYIAAPVLHDYLCNEDFADDEDLQSGYTRFEAATRFRSALQSLGAPWWMILTAYYAVRINDVICYGVGS